MKKKKKINKSKIIILLSFILMVTVFIYIMFNSNLFNSTNIKIEGNERISKDEIIEILEIEENKNIFMYNTNQMEKVIKTNTNVKDAEIKIKIPNQLQVLIIEKEIVAALKGKEGYCYIDKNLDFIKKDEKLQEDKDIMIVNINYEIIDDKIIKFKDEEIKKRLLYLLDNIRENNLNRKINEVNLVKDDIIEIYTKDNIKVIMPNNKIDYNIKILSAILSDLQGNKVNGGTIDFVSSKNPTYIPEDKVFLRK